jgi:hypothetical protein
MTAVINSNDLLVGTVFDRRLKNKKEPVRISQVVDVSKHCRVSEGKVLVFYARANKRLYARCAHCVESGKEQKPKILLRSRYWPVREAREARSADCFPELREFAQKVNAITCMLAECIKNERA